MTHYALGDPLDSDLVRALFRRTVRDGAVIIAIICAMHAGLLLWNDMGLWTSCLAVGVLALALRPCFQMDRSFPVFLAATIGMTGAAIANTIHLSVQAGSDAGFHLILLGIVPVVMVSGRIGTRHKWGVAAGLVAIVVLIELYTPRLGSSFSSAANGPGTATALMAANVLAVGLSIAALVVSYFELVSMQQARLQELSVCDTLTGLFNRRHAHDTSLAFLGAVSRHEQDFSVVLLDLDHFKSINDQHGHDVGDLALKHVASLLRQGQRVGDVCCRWGGEEMLLLLPQTNLEDAMACAERARSALSNTPLPSGGGLIKVTATFGVAAAQSNDSLDAMVSRADKALYEGKRAGRNRVLCSETPVTPSRLGPLRPSPG